MSEKIQITFIETPTLIELKAKYEHLHGKMFYRTSSEEYPIHLTLGNDTYCKIQTEKVYKVRPEDPIVEGTTVIGLFMAERTTQTAHALSLGRQVTTRNCTNVLP